MERRLSGPLLSQLSTSWTSLQCCQKIITIWHDGDGSACCHVLWQKQKNNWDGDRELLSHFRWTRDDLTEIRTSLCKRTVHLIVPYGLLSECDKSNAECLEVVWVLSKFCFFWSFWLCISTKVTYTFGKHLGEMPGDKEMPRGNSVLLNCLHQGMIPVSALWI